MTTTTVKKGVATRAAADVSLWLSAVSDVRVSWTMDDEAAALGIDTDGGDYEPAIFDRSAALPLLNGLHGHVVPLVDYLQKLMSGWISFDLEGIRFSLSPSHYEAMVSIELPGGRRDTETFYVLEPPPDFDPGLDGENRIRTDISVDGTFFAAIAVRTADPLDEATK